MNIYKRVILILLIIIVWFSPSLFAQSGISSGLFKDGRDGKKYKWVKIGNQIWMAENLAYLPFVFSPDTGSITDPFYYVYGYDSTCVKCAMKTPFYKTYGVLYNWIAAQNGNTLSMKSANLIQGICPNGWHLPSDAEWGELIDFVGGSNIAGGRLKESDTIHWIAPNFGASNDFHFSVLPGGYRFINLTFTGMGNFGHFWSATEYDSENALSRDFDNESTIIYSSYINKEIGFSVRCIKN